MFRGLNIVQLDSKGRMAMPSRYRQELQETSEGQLVATIDPEAPCLLLYPLHEWEEIERKLESLPSFNPLTRRIQRLLIGHAADLELDNQGRVLIPPSLREYASLDKSLALVGQGKKFELWNEQEWQSSCMLWRSEGPLQRAHELPAEMQSFSL